MTKQPEPMSQDDLVALQRGEPTKKQKEEMARKQKEACGLADD